MVITLTAAGIGHARAALKWAGMLVIACGCLLLVPLRFIDTSNRALSTRLGTRRCRTMAMFE